MKRPLADVPFETVWHLLFLILMELGVRDGVVTQGGDEVGHANGDEEGDFGRESATAASDLGGGVDETLPATAASNGTTAEPVITPRTL